MEIQCNLFISLKCQIRLKALMPREGHLMHCFELRFLMLFGPPLRRSTSNLPVTHLIRAVLKSQIIKRGWGLLEAAPLGQIQACYRGARLRGLPQGGKHTSEDINWKSRGVPSGHINWTLWPTWWGEWVAFGFQVSSVPAIYQTWAWQQGVIVTPRALTGLAGLINLGNTLHGL